MSRRAIGGIGERLADARSRRVVFVSHCVFNQNVRFLGGATRPGALSEVLEYRRLARRTAYEITDYVSSGFEVVAVVGVGASPSCGVATTLDLNQAVAAMGNCDRDRVDTATVRDRVVAASAIDGEGMFVKALRRQLARRRISVPFREHDLLAELRATSLAIKPR